MTRVEPIPVPGGTFLADYAMGPEIYTDCFGLDLMADVGLADFVEAFYTTRLFKAERLVLRVFAQKPSTDAQARMLGRGETDRFAVWTVKERSDDQLLMKAIGRTSSWFMTAQDAGMTPVRTKIMFGSIVEPAVDRRNGNSRMGAQFTVLLGAHRLYSRLLLSAAARKLLRRRG